MTQPAIAGLPAALALEVDALCDDFERHWRRARRRGLAPPAVEAFASRAGPVARPALLRCLEALAWELSAGVTPPEVPGFLLEEEIGRGGMGVVYRARREANGRACAVKLIPGAEYGDDSGWLAELMSLRHPNLVPMESFGCHAGLRFVVMPFVPGGDLRERVVDLAGRRREVARLGAAVADALAYLHGRGILHRDLKPSNILLDSPQGGEPLVCDFGLAGRLGEGRACYGGTAGYASPEQRAGEPLTPAADVWGLGAVLRELLPDGRVDGLTEAVVRCLRPRPEERFATAATLGTALRDYLDPEAELI